MKLHLSNPGEICIIRRYQPGEIWVNDDCHQRSIVVTPSQVITDWPPQTDQALTSEDFERLVTLKPELVLLGTGREQVFIKPQLTQPLVQAFIGLEIMDTPAACRTYNILAAEKRDVVAALLLP